jgi:subtilisin family serine protease
LHQISKRAGVPIGPDPLLFPWVLRRPWGKRIWVRDLLKCFRFVLLALLISVVVMPGSALAQNEEKGSGGNHQKDERSNIEPRPDEEEIVPGQVIVKYREGVGSTARSNVLRKEGLEKKKDLDLIGAEVGKVKGQSVEQAIRDLESRPDVEYAEPDYIVQSTGYADEPRFGELWGLHNTGQAVGSAPAGTEDVDVNALEASAMTQGDPNLAVAVIDDGVDFSHPDLADRAWINPGEIPGNGLDDDGNGYVDDVTGWDFHNNDDTVHDAEDSHGTHVSGIIAASANGEGVVGVAPNVKIMALKFLGPNGGSTSDAILAIQYAKSEGAKISNNSWGGAGFSQGLQDAIEASGMLFVASAGNRGLDTDELPHYPSSYTNSSILSVAAINNQGKLAAFSNYGANSVDFSAPGVNVLSCVPGATWEFFSGTSIATPYATGVAALAASDSPELLSNPTALKQVLMDTGKPVPATAGKTGTGTMVDAKAVLSPRVTAVFPKPNAKKISPKANVTTNFSEDMLPSSINTATFTLTKRGSSAPVAAFVTYDPGARKATLNPNSKLKRETTYTARVSTGSTDLAGNALTARKSWKFMIEAHR